MQRKLTAIRNRQLTLEIRSQRFSFAAVEGSHLLDWGGCICPAGRKQLATAARKLGELLQLYQPAIVIWRNPRGVKGPKTKRAIAIANAIRRELKKRSISHVVIGRAEIAQCFARDGHRTKHQIAVYLANRFPVLQPSLPPPRKTWDPELYRAAVFDAIATLEAFNDQKEPRE